MRSSKFIAALLILHALILSSLFADTNPTAGLVNYETPHVHPIDLTPDGTKLLVVNTAGHMLEVFDTQGATPSLTARIPVGIDPVSVRARTNNEAWVVNHISDSVSIIDLNQRVVVNTLQTSNEPADVVFAGSPERAFVSCSEANRVEVFNLGNLSQAPISVPIAGEDPRALAVSPDGQTVYAAIFESGNGTTAISGGGSVNAENVTSRPEGPYAGQTPPPNNGNSFSPPMNPSLPAAPNTALIVRKNTANQWLDDNNGDWSIFVNGGLASLTNRTPGWDLPDRDVAVINTQTLAVTYQTRLMTMVMAMAVNPVSGNVSVVGTEALNEIRFEPNLNGVFLRVRSASFNPGGPADIDDLNPHLDYSSSTVSSNVREQSIGDPRGIAWQSNGQQAFITGMGSNNVVVIDSAGNRQGHFPVGEGPTGIVLDESNNRGFVLNKFSGSISVIDLATEQTTAEVAFNDPTPQVIKDGRPFLYNTHLTSGLGHVSCASCHVDARTDRLAWDLGDPSGVMDTVLNANNSTGNTSGTTSVHPMKGAMLTQTLQDIMGFSTLHWRGDREDLGEFNGAFVSLMGAPSQISTENMDKFGDFLDTIHLPPNPYRNIDNSRPSSITLPSGLTTTTSSFNSLRGQNSRSNNCMGCHMNGEQRNDASNRELAQAFVAPAWAPLYDRLGFWPELTNGSTAGFGFFHDGADDIQGAARTNTAENQTDMLAELLTLEGPGGPLVGAERRQDAHAGVGQQVTLNGSLTNAQSNRVNTLVNIASGSSHAELIARSASRGYLLQSNGVFQSDRQGETESLANLIGSATNGDSLTFTLVTNGMGTRLAIDEDLDGVLNQDENESPTIDNPGNQSGNAGDFVSLNVIANDPEGDPLTFTATGLPANLSIDANSGLISGTLSDSAVGISSVTVFVSDGGLGSASVSFEWLVFDPSGNIPPTITPIADQSNREGDAIDLTPVVGNLDNDPLTFTSNTLPTGLSLNSANGRISGTLAAGSAGVYSITLTISDGTASASTVFAWQIGGVHYADSFEQASGWITNPNGTDTATTGIWAIGTPEETASGGVVIPVGNAADGTQALLTGPPAGGGVGSDDIDSGVTSVRSPDITLPNGGTITLSFDYFFAHLANANNDDFFRVTLEGNSNSILLEERADGTVRGGTWTPWSADLSGFAGQTVTLLIEAADAGSASLVEAGVDALSIITIPANEAPIITPIPDQSDDLGTSIGLQLEAIDPNGDTITFGATGLPSGLSITDDGLISGTPNAAGTSTVTVTATDGANTSSISFSWTINDANPAEFDRLSNFNAPATVQQGQSLSVSVDYESTQDHELWVWLQDSNAGWRTVATDNLTLTPGIGTQTFDLTVASDARVGDGYVWVMRLLPQGWASADDALDANYIEGSVTPGDTGGGDPTENVLGSVTFPSEVQSPGTVTLEVPYEVTERRELNVWLHDSTDGWFTIGQASTSVDRGIGTVTLEIPILADAREGDGYVWALRLLPIGWQTADDALDALYGDASATRNTGGSATQNVLGNIDVPTVIEVAETITVNVDYEATERRDLGIWIHDSTDNWRVVGTGLAKVDPGFGTETLTIGIAGDARLGDGYIIAIRLLPEGWATADDALDAFYADAEIVPSSSELVNYAVLPQASSSQSSVFGSAFVSDLARDGNTDGDWRNGSVTHTELDPNAWWEVDLGSVKNLDHILVWNRSDCCGERLVPFYVLVSDAPFVSTDLDDTRNQAGVTEIFVSEEPSPTRQIAVGRSGRFVRIQLAGSNYLSLAEVEVYGENEGPVNGVAYEYYEGTWDALPAFDDLTPFATGTGFGVNFNPALRGDFFGLRFRACLNIPADGTYTFYTSSDEGSRLLLDGQLVVENDGVHTEQEASGTVTLTAGMHPMEVQYFERDGDEALTLSWEGPGFTKEIIPDARFTLNETGDNVGFQTTRRIRPNDNADGDLLDLAAENALGMNPYNGHLPHLGLQAEPHADGHGVNLWFERPARLTEYQYELEVSSDASTWQSLAPSEVLNEVYGWERVRYNNVNHLFTNARDLGFARLKIKHTAWQYETTTPVIAWQRTILHEGYQTHGISLPLAPVYASKITGVNSDGFTTAASGLQASFGTGIAGSDDTNDVYYAELTSGAHAGHRFVIDVSHSLDQEISIDWRARANTRSTLSDEMVGASVVVRPFHTLSNVYSETLFQSGRGLATADHLQFFRDGRYHGYVLIHDGHRAYWTQSGNASLPNLSDATINPGEGCFIHRTPGSGPLALMVTGHLRTTPFAQPLYRGHQLLASPAPITYSPLSRGYDPARGFAGDVNPEQSDQFLLWMADTNSGEQKLQRLLPLRRWRYLATVDSRLRTRPSPTSTI